MANSAIRRGQHRPIIDATGAAFDILLLLADQQVEVVVFHFGRRRRWGGTTILLLALALVSRAGAQIFVIRE